MSVRRRQNWLGQQRVDAPHLKSVESAVSNDFDELLSGLVIGENKSYIVRGLKINMPGSIGASANGLQLLVENSAVLHGNSDQSGTFFTIHTGTPPEISISKTNEKVEGAFTPSTDNYVGIEFTRAIDDATTDQVYFWNPTTNVEITKTVPLAIIMDYKIVIATSAFAANVLPIAVVQTDSSNNVISITDRRPLLHRLGTAGDLSPDPFYSYPWNDSRTENFYTSTSSTISPFEGGDKQITSMKEFFDALMTEFKLLKGTPFWYSESVGGSIARLRQDTANTAFTGRGLIAHDEVTPGKINWTEDVFLNFIGGRLRYKITANPSSSDVSLTNNQVAYINLVRGVNIIPNLVFTNGGSVVTSVGNVSWTADLEPGDFIKDASRGDEFYYEIQSIDSASQATLTEVYQELSSGPAGFDAQYAFGIYETSPAPITDRHIKIADRGTVPFGQDYFWLFFRQDDSGVLPKIYVRMLGGQELEQGEEREISDNTSRDILSYIGSASESDSTPDYTNSIVTSVNEVFDITFPAGSSINSGEYFIANTALDLTKHYFWFNVDSAGGDPLVPGRFGHEIAISSLDSDLDVAAAAQAVIDSVVGFSAVDNLDGTVTTTLSLLGNATDAANVDVTGLSIVVSTQGAGSTNNYVQDNENLTRSIKRLDEALGAIGSTLTQPKYEEILSVVSGAPADDNEITGPVIIGSTFSIPLNARNSDIQQTYVVGSGDLSVYLNGIKLFSGIDYNEVGTIGSDGHQIETLWQLEIGDIILLDTKK